MSVGSFRMMTRVRMNFSGVACFCASVNWTSGSLPSMAWARASANIDWACAVAPSSPLGDPGVSPARSVASNAMMAMTASSSMSVKARRKLFMGWGDNKVLDSGGTKESEAVRVSGLFPFRRTA